MSVRIIIQPAVWDRLVDYHLRKDKQVEALSYVWARAEHAGGDTAVYICEDSELVLFSGDCFERQTGGNVALAVDVKVGMLIRFLQSSFNALINVHDHWFSDVPQFSSQDDADDLAFERELRTKLAPHTGRPGFGPKRSLTNVAMVLGQSGADARIVSGTSFEPADAITVGGEHWRSIELPRHSSWAQQSGGAATQRQSDFVSPGRQADIARMTIAIAGCGGMGSVLAESFGRIGATRLCLIDDDRLDTTNLNRWQGAQPSMVGSRKADILAGRLAAMFPGMQVTAIGASLFSRPALAALAASDVVIGAVDNDAARYFLNRFSVQYLRPYFDAGVSVDGRLEGVDFSSRYFAVLPGVSACASCSACDLYDSATAAAAFTDEHTMSALRAAGYVRDEPAGAPSVYSLNQQAASMLMTEFLNFVCGWRPTATVAYEKWRSCEKRRLDRSGFPETPAPDCPVCSYYLATGSSEPLPAPSRTVDLSLVDIN